MYAAFLRPTIVEIITCYFFYFTIKVSIMQTKIILADDHSMIRKGIRMLCESALGYKEIEEVT